MSFRSVAAAPCRGSGQGPPYHCDGLLAGRERRLPRGAAGGHGPSVHAGRRRRPWRRQPDYALNFVADDEGPLMAARWMAAGLRGGRRDAPEAFLTTHDGEILAALEVADLGRRGSRVYWWSVCVDEATADAVDADELRVATMVPLSPHEDLVMEIRADASPVLLDSSRAPKRPSPPARSVEILAAGDGRQETGDGLADQVADLDLGTVVPMPRQPQPAPGRGHRPNPGIRSPDGRAPVNEAVAAWPFGLSAAPPPAG